MSEQVPRVMIECPHLVTVQLGAQISCSMCGSVWGGRLFPLPGESPTWDKRMAQAVAYQERKERRANRWLWRKVRAAKDRWYAKLDAWIDAL